MRVAVFASLAVDLSASSNPLRRPVRSCVRMPFSPACGCSLLFQLAFVFPHCVDTPCPCGHTRSRLRLHPPLLAPQCSLPASPQRCRLGPLHPLRPPPPPRRPLEPHTHTGLRRPRTTSLAACSARLLHPNPNPNPSPLVDRCEPAALQHGFARTAYRLLTCRVRVRACVWLRRCAWICVSLQSFQSAAPMYPPAAVAPAKPPVDDMFASMFSAPAPAHAPAAGPAASVPSFSASAPFGSISAHHGAPVPAPRPAVVREFASSASIDETGNFTKSCDHQASLPLGCPHACGASVAVHCSFAVW